MKTLAVFCGAYEGNDVRYAVAGRNLVRVMAERKMGLVYGAGNIGMMGVIANEMMPRHAASSAPRPAPPSWPTRPPKACSRSLPPSAPPNFRR